MNLVELVRLYHKTHSEEYIGKILFYDDGDVSIPNLIDRMIEHSMTKHGCSREFKLELINNAYVKLIDNLKGFDVDKGEGLVSILGYIKLSVSGVPGDFLRKELQSYKENGERKYPNNCYLYDIYNDTGDEIIDLISDEGSIVRGSYSNRQEDKIIAKLIVEEAKASLTPKRRKVIEWTIIKDKTQTELATKWGQSQQNISKLQNKGLTSIKKYITTQLKLVS